MVLSQYDYLPDFEKILYVVRHPDLGLFKIGVTGQPKNRIKAIAGKHKCYVEPIILFKCDQPNIAETILHKAFANKRVLVGTECEWFQLTEEEIEAIKHSLQAITK